MKDSLNNMRTRIAITTTSFAKFDSKPLKFLKKWNFEYRINELGRKLHDNEIIKFCAGCNGIIAGTELYGHKILSNLNELKVISRCGSGIENIDMEAAKRRKIKVFNTPYGPTLAVAELTLGLMINLLRKINFMNKEINSACWNKRMGELLSGQKVGIIGFGKIGKKITELLKPFGCQVCFFDPNVNEGFLNTKKMTKDRLLSWANIISIHASSGSLLLKRKDLLKMKKGSYLLNLSRGGVVDECALHDLLKKKHIGAAALDVFESEPYSGNLTKLSNIILTPHIGSYAREARVKMEIDAVNNLLKGLKKEK